MMLACGPANADELNSQDSMGLYVSVFAGASDPNTLKTTWLTDSGGSIFETSLKLKTGYILGGAVGVQVNDNVRGEVELSRIVVAATDLIKVDGNGTVSPFSSNGHLLENYVLGNIWLDYKNETAFTPYAGGGVGFGWVDSALGGSFFPTHFDDSVGINLALQLGAGVKYAVSDALAVDLGYRYRAMPNVRFNVTGNLHDRKNGDVESHSLLLGLSYRF